MCSMGMVLLCTIERELWDRTREGSEKWKGECDGMEFLF